MITSGGGLQPVLRLCEDNDTIVRRLALLSMLAVYIGQPCERTHQSICFPTSNLDHFKNTFFVHKKFILNHGNGCADTSFSREFYHLLQIFSLRIVSEELPRQKRSRQCPRMLKKGENLRLSS